jgi:hypothetical protein
LQNTHIHRTEDRRYMVVIQVVRFCIPRPVMGFTAVNGLTENGQHRMHGSIRQRKPSL